MPRSRRTVVEVALLGVLFATAACDRGESSGPTTSRSEQVVASAPLPAPAAPEAAAPHVAPTPPRRTKLCEGDGNARGRNVSKVLPAHVEAAGAPRLDGAQAVARGQWTWVNFWAAWCGPCKEEMPRLLGWQEALLKAGAPVRFTFVSLDDDRRQLEQLLEAQPPAGLKTSFWLPEGPTRASWLQSLKMKSAPELPEQALIDPTGKVRCFIEGAVDDGDYAEVAALVGR